MIPIDQQIPSIGCVVNLTVLGYNWLTLNWISKKNGWMDWWKFKSTVNEHLCHTGKEPHS